MREAAATLAATDGYPLAVTRFAPSGSAWMTVVVASAMGVRRDFYAPYARHLAAEGAHVLTFDYRGMGGSRPARLGRLEASVDDWAARDLEAVLAEARRAATALPLVVVGHSLGGQILGLAPSNAAVRAAVHVTAGSGWYRLNRRMALRVRLLWFVLMPLAVPLAGYFPGKALRAVGDLPHGVARQWRRWCLHPDYLLSEGEAARAAYARVSAPILSWSFEDDPMISREAVDRLERHYRHARIERRHVAPGEVGRAAIGHFGYFAEASRETLWRESLDWLRARTAEDCA